MSNADDLVRKLKDLRPRQRERLEQMVKAFTEGCMVTALPGSTVATPDFCQEFGDLLRLHHTASSAPMSKDKVEYAMVSALNDSGHMARKLDNGNPGADILVDGEPWSLKSQADAGIRADRLHISKFMELGKGNWTNADDVAQLRDRMFAHMRNYARIFSLRRLSRDPVESGATYLYELVEIPKELLLRSAQFPIEMKDESRQTPKPASCYVVDLNYTRLFELYFDGGTERKLQVRNLLKRECTVHATWTFTAAE